MRNRIVRFYNNNYNNVYSGDWTENCRHEYFSCLRCIHNKYCAIGKIFRRTAVVNSGGFVAGIVGGRRPLSRATLQR